MGDIKIGEDGDGRHGRSVRFRQVEHREVRQDFLMTRAPPLERSGGAPVRSANRGDLFAVTLASPSKIGRGRGRVVLSLSGVSKAFPGVRALHDVGLALHEGEVTALVGENGAGKSTLVKILTGIYTPDAGAIAVHGGPSRSAEPARRLGRRHRRHSPGDGDVRRAFHRRKHLHGSRAQRADRAGSIGRRCAKHAGRSSTRWRAISIPTTPLQAAGRRAEAYGRHRPGAIARRARSSSWTSRPPRSPRDEIEDLSASSSV